MTLFRQQAALFFEAATFIGKSRTGVPEVSDFIRGLPKEARDECARIVGGLNRRSPHYVGDWLRDHRNLTFHYSEVSSDGTGEGEDELMRAMEDAAELPGGVHIGDTLGDVRLWFADEVAVQWLPSDDEPETIAALREALLAAVRFTQRLVDAYMSGLPRETFAEES